MKTLANISKTIVVAAIMMNSLAANALSSANGSYKANAMELVSEAVSQKLGVMLNISKGSYAITYNAATKGNAELRVVSADGTVVFQQAMNTVKGKNVVEVTDFKTFAKGDYMVYVSVDNTVSSRKIVKK